jgi:hypothetical protein
MDGASPPCTKAAFLAPRSPCAPSVLTPHLRLGPSPCPPPGDFFRRDRAVPAALSTHTRPIIPPIRPRRKGTIFGPSNPARDAQEAGKRRCVEALKCRCVRPDRAGAEAPSIKSQMRSSSDQNAARPAPLSLRAERGNLPLPRAFGPRSMPVVTHAPWLVTRKTWNWPGQSAWRGRPALACRGHPARVLAVARASCPWSVLAVAPAGLPQADSLASAGPLW